MARYYPGDHDDTVVKPLPLGVGRQNDEEAKDTSVVLAQNVEGGKVGDTVQVSADRANWLLMHGIASRPEDWVDQYPADGITEPVLPEPDPEPDPKPDPEPDPKPDPKPDPEPDEGEGAA